MSTARGWRGEPEQHQYKLLHMEHGARNTGTRGRVRDAGKRERPSSGVRGVI